MPSIFISDTLQKEPDRQVTGEFVELFGDQYYCIHSYDTLEPFFISLISSSDHWLFISSTGGMTAGRTNAEHALFPYYTEDKLSENGEHTGSKTIFLVTQHNRTYLWEPFSEKASGCYKICRSIYKNTAGSSVIFEEVNFDLGLTYRYAWRAGDVFGFVKTAWLSNLGETACRIELIDGLQNILPANVSSQTQNQLSVLLDAYKRSELEKETGLGIFSLSSILTDLAEPSESLLATTVAQIGLEPTGHLLCSNQLDGFRSGRGIAPEMDVRGRRGAYFAHAFLKLEPAQEHTWHFIADVEKDHSDVARLIEKLKGDPAVVAAEIEADIASNHRDLWKLVGSADGLQLSGATAVTRHHFANVLFNIMRGGVFPNQYLIETADLSEFVRNRNRELHQTAQEFFTSLPARVEIADLLALAERSGLASLRRLCYSYLPLTFSRRHGDPSRPWNRFAIQINNPDGSQKFGYEGNWRDIFQNWEALAYSYPEFTENMLFVFLNATTVDGYNPYRITHQSIDWERPEPDNPWANIGYWSDHQIIYLQKLMEVSVKIHPGKLLSFLEQPIFSYANIPYRIKPYADLLLDPYNTIDFDWELDAKIEALVDKAGTDGKLVGTADGQVLHVSLVEKLLTLLLAKLVNFVPEGGIWMNTQRPEWNDANNALVGKGLSVVTLGYLRRFVVFVRELLTSSRAPKLQFSTEISTLFREIFAVLSRFQHILPGAFSDAQRQQVMDGLGLAGSTFRWNYYENGLSGEMTALSVSELIDFLRTVQEYIEHTLHANQRSDALYHAYNILHLQKGAASVSHLYEMLEGQVAILSSGMLSGEEALQLLTALRGSRLYQPDQHSYLLYPNRNLDGFLTKNAIPSEQVQNLELFAVLLEAGDQNLITLDINGTYHFNSRFRNVRDVEKALQVLQTQPRYAGLVAAESEKVKALFETVFRHQEFTGRAGTFFGYEGLGSIYWHMISKLLLAVQETAIRFREGKTGSGLRAAYWDVRDGLGFNKSPAVYGTFPTDPYSHTPLGRGAKQPGMTGMVKEELLTRWAEVGLFIQDQQFVFDFLLLDRQELLTKETLFSYLDVHGEERQIQLKTNSLAYTVCQVPVILQADTEKSISIHLSDGGSLRVAGLVLDLAHSRHIMQRDGLVDRVIVHF